MRFAGTCSRYSKNAMPQLTRTAIISGRVRRSRRWAYHANVMNTFEQIRSNTVRVTTPISHPQLDLRPTTYQLPATSYQLDSPLSLRRMTSFSPDQTSLTAHTLISTNPSGSATSRMVSSVISVGTLEAFLGHDDHTVSGGLRPSFSASGSRVSSHLAQAGF